MTDLLRRTARSRPTAGTLGLLLVMLLFLGSHSLVDKLGTGPRPADQAGRVPGTESPEFPTHPAFRRVEPQLVAGYERLPADSGG